MSVGVHVSVHMKIGFSAVQTVKKEIEVSKEKDQRLLAKASLDIPLLDENPDDIQLATTVRFHSQLGMLMVLWTYTELTERPTDSQRHSDD